MADQITEKIFDGIAFDTGDKVESDPIPACLYSAKSVVIIPESTGASAGNGTVVTLEGSHDGETFIPITGYDYTLKTVGLANILENIVEHINYLRLTVENKEADPATNYFTITAVLMGRK